MSPADSTQLLTLVLAALSLAVSLMVLIVLLRRQTATQTPRTASQNGSDSGPYSSPVILAQDDRQLVAVLTAAIQSYHGNIPSAATSAGFVIRKIRRV